MQKAVALGKISPRPLLLGFQRFAGSALVKVRSMIFYNCEVSFAWAASTSSKEIVLERSR